MILGTIKKLIYAHVYKEEKWFPNSYTIAREDVATTLVQALDINSLQRASIFIQSGDHDIKDALNQVQ
ncbi:Uncharacterised protein [Staphylococcus caeli]|uniref:Uncharacterized protein n=1 Tax=Staphylococcus caeli TaxID=2201815 RepID=A0A1D4JM54_9STAP|nr:Uncharacterised protein [Staphylococcus caeli]SCS62900.1 Uncharacterised protein [Staphylococcus caeli]